MTKWQQKGPPVHWSQRLHELPVKHVNKLSKEVFASYSGPAGGLTNVEPKQTDGTISWTNKHDRAYGIATSLYEFNPLSKATTGDPIADVLAICARVNSAILVMADGVNWGDKPRLAARCAVKACMSHLNKKLYTGKVNTTRDIFEDMKVAFDEAHRLIMENEGTMTTLTATVVVQIKGSEQFAVCTLNVGDSLGFVYNKESGVREATAGCRDPNQTRDMKLCGGALGPVDGMNPDLTNLTYSLTVAEPGDLVFLTSDGISDNFDPVVAHRAVAERPITAICTCPPTTVEQLEKQDMDELLPCFDPPRRQHDSLRHMEMAIVSMEAPNENLNASTACAKLLQYVVNKTEAKRKRLEELNEQFSGQQDQSPATRRSITKQISSIMQGLPGKLDHAAIVAYQVGHFEIKKRPRSIGHVGNLQEVDDWSCNHPSNFYTDSFSYSPQHFT
ncbi:PP2C-like domain-containing protein CG9801 isoform X2 [Ptychodera flava]|uniref:PP2C-like domain-containing protein CG9801 isoform X2 n=1 Tax=Ptychodera flava TaxID=63121 RepID=UPI003969E7EE